MKFCGKCKRRKPLAQFSRSKGKRDGRCSNCKSCHVKYHRKWYKRNRVARRKQIHGRRSRLIFELRKWASQFKRQCVNCPETDPAALDYHHLDPKTKQDSVSRLVTQLASKAVILREIKKCIVVCANCHRKHHAKRAGYNLSI